MNRYCCLSKAVLAGVSIVFFSASLFADPNYEGDMQLSTVWSFGSGKMQIGPLNRTIQDLGLPAISKKPFQIEYGSHFLIQQLVIDGGIGGVFWKSSVLGNNKASLLGCYSQVSFGVNFLLPNDSWQLYPFFTLGAAAYRFSYHAESIDFTKSTSTGTTTAAYWLPTFITGTGGALYFNSYNAETRKTFTIGIKGGVLMDPSKQSTWYKNGVKYRNGPAPFFAGPFLQLVIGGGRYLN